MNDKNPRKLKDPIREVRKFEILKWITKKEFDKLKGFGWRFYGEKE